MDEDGTYAPQSPDLSAFQTSFSPQQPINYYPPQQPHQNSQLQYRIASFPQTAAYNPTPYSVQQHPTPYHPSAMPNNGHSPGRNDDGDLKSKLENLQRASARMLKKQKVKVEAEVICDKPAPGVEEGIEVKTKFPVARIKRIMQADEDVGKVSQVTPTAVSKALELFMISIVTKAAKEAKAKSSKRVTAAHLKQACERDEQWDFLASIMEKVPDVTQAKKEEESEDGAEGKKRKGGPRRRKRESDEF